MCLSENVTENVLAFTAVPVVNGATYPPTSSTDYITRSQYNDTLTSHFHWNRSEKRTSLWSAKIWDLHTRSVIKTRGLRIFLIPQNVEHAHNNYLVWFGIKETLLSIERRWITYEINTLKLSCTRSKTRSMFIINAWPWMSRRTRWNQRGMFRICAIHSEAYIIHNTCYVIWTFFARHFGHLSLDRLRFHRSVQTDILMPYQYSPRPTSSMSFLMHL